MIKNSTSDIARPFSGTLLFLAVAGAVSVAAVLPGCGDDDDDTDSGMGGSSMTAGGMGGDGMGGDGMGGDGMGGSSMTAGGMGGSGMGGSGMGGDGMGGSSMATGGMGMTAGGPTGTVEVLSADPSLLAPTTVAIRGDLVFAPLAQFGTLFGPDKVQPFQAVSVPLAGGALGDSIALPNTVVQPDGGELGFHPEGITAADDGTLYIGSLTGGGIVRVPPDSTTAEAFLAPEDTVDGRGVVGLTVDEARDILWFCESSPIAATPGGALVGLSTAAGTEGTEVARHPLPNAGFEGRAAFCNDTIVSPEGDVLVSESWGGFIYVIPADNVMDTDSAEVWSNAPELKPEIRETGFGVNGLEFVGDVLVFANAGLFVMDPNSRESAQAIQLLGDDAEFTVGGGPDGLALVPGSTNELVVADNGGRIIKVTLDLE